MNLEINCHTQQLLDDLAWVANSPPLFRCRIDGDGMVGSAEADESVGHLHSRKAEKADAITLDEVDPVHLADFMLKRNDYRVGRYFERLVLYWIQFVRKREILEHAVQIKADNRTIGEVDLIYRNELGQVTHLETAVKFYLFRSEQLDLERSLLGPNANDSFQKKSAKLVNQQLPLSFKYFPDVECREALMKGRIFFSKDGISPLSGIENLQPGHLTGRWCYAKDFSENVATDVTQLQVAAKPHWLSTSNSIAEPLSRENAIELVDQHVTRDRKPLLLLAKSSITGSQIENPQPFFVMPNHWPGQRTARK